LKPIRFLVLLVAATASLLAPAKAYAHLHLERSAPAANDTLTAAPSVIRLTYSESVELGFSDLSLVGPLGEVRLGELVVPVDSPAVLEARIVGRLVAGEYTVRWQAASADGHPMRGEYTFTIAADAEGLPPAVPTAAITARPDTTPPPARAATFGVESPGYVAVRWGTFVALLAVIGAVAFRLLVLAPLADDKETVSLAATRAARLGLWAAALLFLAAFLRLGAESAAVSGTLADATHAGGIVFGTIWGAGWLLEVGGALVALAGFLLARRGADVGWLIAALGAVALAFFPALSGHAVSEERFRFATVIADGLHVFSAGGWLGSLLFLLVVGIPSAGRARSRDRGETLTRMVTAFSAPALTFAALLLLTGIFASWVHLGSLSALTGTAYGKTLLGKLAVVAVVAVAGVVNWRSLRPKLGSDGVPQRLRRSAAFELAAALLVLVITAALVGTPLPPH
jgi:copper transport protein